uniref:Sugar phosphate transporter domain-containing protein n=1 Tax=Alexandrium monilatum TaxID=311494 RepID=A0A7S4S7A4_9DINO
MSYLRYPTSPSRGSSPVSACSAEMSGPGQPISPAIERLMYVKKLLLCLVYILVSAGLIRFNKLMMKRDHFPHALALSAVHMIVSSVFCSVLYFVAPSMFPGMATSRGHRSSPMKWFVPIGLCFAIMLFSSNQAYAYCNVTFLQFMKEVSVMLVFVFSCIVGLESLSRPRILVIIWVVVGASISVSGEARFKWIGFIFQGVSQLAECSRLIIGEILLSGKKLDPLTYNLFLAPTCPVVLLIANAAHWSPGTWSDFCAWWPLLSANACVALCLNILVAAVIKECSAVGFVLTGLTKDIAIVIFSAVAFHEGVTGKQAAAFVITIAGVFFWSYMKINPSAPPVQMLEKALCSEPRAAPDEKTPLVLKEDPSPAEKHV